MPDVVTIRGSRFTEDVTDMPWQDLPTEVLQREQQCWTFHPKASWHGYAGYADGYTMVDPNKLTLLTPGIDRAPGNTSTSGCRRRWSPTTCGSSTSSRRSAT